MDTFQVEGRLGAPLLTSTGRGLLHWNYDHSGDVLFVNGLLNSWTKPTICAPLSHPQRNADKKPDSDSSAKRLPAKKS
jgi:hypothetical protein